MIKQAGRIVFEGLEATRFWVRAFDLQKEIDTALSLIANKPKSRELIACPIISEYEINTELKLIFVIMADVDTLGLCGGSGMIYFTSPERETELRAMRDHFADDLLEFIKSSTKPREIIVVEEGKERGRED